MAIVTYRDLCLDAVNAPANAAFWAAALGLQVHETRASTVRLEGHHRHDRVWVNSVTEPHTVKNRWHLDVNTESVQRLEQLGATVLDATSHAWTIMTDPDGGELCAFVREGGIERRLYEIVADCTDPERQARWWHGLLGGTLGSDAAEGWHWVENIPGTPFECIVFAAVPEPKTVKNRVHLDVNGPLDAVLTHGAAQLDQHADWAVVADPEGNELCVFP